MMGSFLRLVGFFSIVCYLLCTGVRHTLGLDLGQVVCIHG